MKKIFLYLICFMISSGLSAQRVKTSTNKTTTVKEVTQTITEVEEVKSKATIDFVSKVIDYGVIDHNSDGVRKFIFTNNGTEPLVIKNAKGSCGCTVPTVPKDPIAPGETSEIGVKYATNRVGVFTKTITLTSNASKKPVILTIKGEVNPPQKDQSVPEKNNTGAPLENK